MAKNLVLFCTLFALLLSCKKADKSEPVDPETQDAVWIKLSIPKQIRGVSAIYGSIDDTLIVATTYTIYITIDQGRSWEMVNDPRIGISGFTKYRGELIALSNFGGGYASGPLLYSLDQGKTWSRKGLYDYRIYNQIRQSRDTIAADGQLQFKIQSQPGKKDEENNGLPLWQPDLLVKVENGREGVIHFPFKRDLNYLHLDSKNRLYVGAEGIRFEWTEQNGKRVYPVSTDSALLYISRLSVNEL